MEDIDRAIANAMVLLEGKRERPRKDFFLQAGRLGRRIGGPLTTSPFVASFEGRSGAGCATAAAAVPHNRDHRSVAINRKAKTPEPSGGFCICAAAR
jgi:hypothetical protein